MAPEILNCLRSNGSSDTHKTAVDEAEHEKEIAVGESLAPKHVVPRDT